MEVTQLALLIWVGWANGEQLTSTCVQISFDFDQRERKTSQFNKSARKTWPNAAASILSQLLLWTAVNFPIFIILFCKFGGCKCDTRFISLIKLAT